MHKHHVVYGVWPRCTLSGLLIGFSLLLAATAPAREQRFDGFNVIVTPGHPFGSASAQRALIAAKVLGATTVAIIPFLWQRTPSDACIVRGTDMPDDALRGAIRQAHALGFSVVVKPHVWVPESWAGAIEPVSEQGWVSWFSCYRTELDRIARIAAVEGADILAIGTELTKTTQRPEWSELISTARAAFPRTLAYVAHNIDEAEVVPFWHLLDVIGVSLYPPLGADNDRAGHIAVMQHVMQRIDVLSKLAGKPVLVGEVGLRSAMGAAAKPWESAEERATTPDPQLQAEVIVDWLSALDRPAIRGVLIWRWLTDPSAGGPTDTDFTVQGKPAEAALHCAWSSNQNLYEAPSTRPFSCKALRPQ
jgi:hypothetical protein